MWYEKLLTPLVTNWPLVVVAIWGIFVARNTLTTIVEQTGATKTAAQAALLNAQAVINAERAWVVVELHPVCHQAEDGRWVGEDGVSLSNKEILRGNYTAHSLKIRNMGRTPAQILSYDMAYSCLPEGVTNLPPGHVGDVAGITEYNRFLADGNPIEVLPPFNIANFMMYSMSEINERKKTAVFHGWVKYRHMFSSEDCISEYCYAYNPSLKRLTMVGRHTKYT